MVYVPDPLLASPPSAVAAAPDDLPLRLHYGQLLLAAGQSVEALTEAATVVRADPSNQTAQQLLADASAAVRGEPAPETSQVVSPEPEVAADPPAAALTSPERTDSDAPAAANPFDWSEAEKAFEGIVP